MFRLLKMKELAPLSAPSPAREKLQWETAEQSNRALPVTVAIGTPEVGQIPSDAQSAHQHEESQESPKSNSLADIPKLSRASQDLAATKIQASFRGYLVSFFGKQKKKTIKNSLF